MPRSHADKRPARRIQSIEVGFRLIRALEAGEGYLPLKDVAGRAGMAPSKAYLYLVSFVREGLVQQDSETGHYGLGPFAFQLGLAAVRQADPVRLAREELDALRKATSCAAYVSVWGNRGPVIALKVDGERQGSMAIRTGFVLPLLRTATGRVFLAHLPVDETAALVAEELRGTGQRRALMDEMAPMLKAVRRKGFAVSEASRAQINAGFGAMAAPVFDYSGRIAAALAILGPRPLMTSSKRAAHAAVLVRTAVRLSEKLGHRRRT